MYGDAYLCKQLTVDIAVGYYASKCCLYNTTTSKFLTGYSYDNIYYLKNNIFFAVNNDQYSVIDNQGVEIVPSGIITEFTGCHKISIFVNNYIRKQKIKNILN